MSQHNNFFYNLEKSAIVTFIWIVILFSFSIAIILIAPRHIDPSWNQPTSPYQVQMYEKSDPNLYISSATTRSYNLQYVYHLKEHDTLLGFFETEVFRIVAPPELEKVINRYQAHKQANQNTTSPKIKLTSQLLMLRKPEAGQKGFNPVSIAEKMQKDLQEEWEKSHPNWKEEDLIKPAFEVFELYVPEGKEAFALAPSGLILENWIDHNYLILDEEVKQPYHQSAGVIYVNNPREYRISKFQFGHEVGWNYDPEGEKIQSIEQLKSHELGFRSRQELINLGEHIYAIEGCWYCHTDQTRTLVQDVVLNGSDSYPAPPSSANEFIYQRITFPGTRRIGPDLSRVGVKRPSRDWHKGHFWAPKTASQGSIMPAFRHFFDADPRGTSPSEVGIPNYKFEAIFQYLMTKGTRITPPNQAWWLGKDPIKTKEIIEGERRLK